MGSGKLLIKLGNLLQGHSVNSYTQAFIKKIPPVLGCVNAIFSIVLKEMNTRIDSKLFKFTFKYIYK